MGEGSPTKDHRKKGTLILTSLLEDLVFLVCPTTGQRYASAQNDPIGRHRGPHPELTQLGADPLGAEPAMFLCAGLIKANRPDLTLGFFPPYKLPEPSKFQLKNGFLTPKNMGRYPIFTGSLRVQVVFVGPIRQSTLSLLRSASKPFFLPALLSVAQRDCVMPVGLRN